MIVYYIRDINYAWPTCDGYFSCQEEPPEVVLFILLCTIFGSQFIVQWQVCCLSSILMQDNVHSLLEHRTVGVSVKSKDQNCWYACCRLEILMWWKWQQRLEDVRFNRKSWWSWCWNTSKGMMLLIITIPGGPIGPCIPGWPVAPGAPSFPCKPLIPGIPGVPITQLDWQPHCSEVLVSPFCNSFSLQINYFSKYWYSCSAQKIFFYKDESMDVLT